MRGWQVTRRFLILGVALLLVGTACVSARPEPGPAPEPTPEAPPPATPVATSATPTQAPATPTPTVAPPTPEPGPAVELEPYDGKLVSMRLPSLGVEAAIESIGIIEELNELDVPEWDNIGWYEILDRPGFGKPGFGETSLFSAHKDYWPKKQGPFYALTELRNGDRVVVVMDDGREYVYEVFFQQRYRAEDLPIGDLRRPHEAEDPVFQRPTGEEWIALYTCGGEFVPSRPGGPGEYVHRDLVLARLVQTVPPEAARATSGWQP